MALNPYASYKRQAVTTATPGEIVVKLYDEALKQLNRAVDSIGEKNYERKNKALQKADAIFDALHIALDMSVEISKNLEQLYLFFIRKIREANMHNDVDVIKEIYPLIADLRDAWKQAAAMTKEQMEAQAAANAMNGVGNDVSQKAAI